MSRLRDAADHAAWREFEDRYRDLLLGFCQRRGLQRADSEDVVQTVFTSLVQTLPTFVYDRQRGRFRDYLYRSTRIAISAWAARPNRAWAALSSSTGALRPDQDSEPGVADAAWEQEWVAHHYRLAMATVRRSFDTVSIQIFDRSVAGAKVVDLAREFDMSEAAVHKVRQRIRDRMEELIAAQIREEDAVDDAPRPG
jgi:RNA polymerase sigma-70 factor (ECF subfamily)